MPLTLEQKHSKLTESCKQFLHELHKKSEKKGVEILKKVGANRVGDRESQSERIERESDGGGDGDGGRIGGRIYGYEMVTPRGLPMYFSIDL